jgi:hypothetical protein
MLTSQQACCCLLDDPTVAAVVELVIDDVKDAYSNEARKQEEAQQLAGALGGVARMGPLNAVIDAGKKIVPNNLACVKAASNANYPWAIWFMHFAKDNNMLARAGVTDRDTCMAKRDQIAEEAEKEYASIGRGAVKSAGECLCKQVY